MTDAEARMTALGNMMRFAGNGLLGLYQAQRSDPMMVGRMKELVKAATQEDLDLMLPKISEPTRELVEYCKLLVKIDYLEAELVHYRAPE